MKRGSDISRVGADCSAGLQTCRFAGSPACRSFEPRNAPEDFRGAGFQTCGIADFQVGGAWTGSWLAGLETRDTADLEVCATVPLHRPRGTGLRENQAADERPL
jgi:hypothetical protein